MASRNPDIFLERLLLSLVNKEIINTGSKTSKIPQSIIQTWAELRQAVQDSEFRPNHLKALQTLESSKESLYVADPQANLLLSILSFSNVSLPHQAYPLLFTLLYVWVRKSSRPSLKLIESAVELLSRMHSSFVAASNNSHFLPEAAILFGSLSYRPGVSPRYRNACLDMLCKALGERHWIRCSSSVFVSHVLAGIGYALSAAGTKHFLLLVDSLLATWVDQIESDSCVPNAVMVLHLVEWVFHGFIYSNALKKIELFGQEMQNPVHGHVSSLSLMMAAFGLLKASRSINLNGAAKDIITKLGTTMEDIIESMASDMIHKAGYSTSPDKIANNPAVGLTLKCMSVGLARSTLFCSRPCLLFCLTSALLMEVFPLKRFYSRVLEYVHGNSELPCHREVEKHIESIPFREAGASTAVLCNQYAIMDNEGKCVLENLLWTYCHDIHVGHQQITLLLGKDQKFLLEGLEKIAESAFFMVVVLVHEIVRKRLTPENSPENCLKISLSSLISFSYMDYFRRARVAEYMNTVRAAVVNVQENEGACISFVESMPTYADITNPKGPYRSQNQQRYSWSDDDVQTARIVFYIRVLPTWIAKLPTVIFRERVFSTMFLYMLHPVSKAVRASHALFVSFMSSAENSGGDERASLKEQLVFYYVDRSLQGYPDTCPFDVVASAMVAIVGHLPAGSPSIFYCIDWLARKADELCDGGKLLELLMRLVFMVDIQVLPSLMKLLAELIAMKMTVQGQSAVMEEFFRQVSESDDVTRKPVLVSWLHSLSHVISSVPTRGSQDELLRPRF